jgi:2-oxoglutarate ferredoxin oxidoreductase subunit beta
MCHFQQYHYLDQVLYLCERSHGYPSITDFVQEKREIKASVKPGEHKVIEMHDGSLIELSALVAGWDPTDRPSAINAIHKANSKGEVLTALIFVDTDQKEVHKI